MNYRVRRQRFADKWSGEPFVLQGAPRPNDALPWRQDRDFLYMTGVDEPNAALQFKEGEWTLFLEERSPWDALWHGERRSLEEITELSGIQQGLCHSGASPQGDAIESMVRQAHHDIGSYQSEAGLQDDITANVRTFIRSMRLIKDVDEIAALKRANEISLKMFADVEAHIAPGVNEAEIEGELYRLMKKYDGEGWAYPPIIASGVNATVLHYTKNNRTIESGDLVLIDAGAEFAGYASDVTRTFCAGEIGGERKAIRDLVSEAQRAAAQVAVVGKTLADVDAAARAVLRDGLKELEVITDVSAEVGAEKVFFPHRTSHWLGLDVHDPCPLESPLVVGTAFTIEPGLYFRITDDPLDIYRGRLEDGEIERLSRALGDFERFRSIGVRVEDDVMLG